MTKLEALLHAYRQTEYFAWDSAGAAAARIGRLSAEFDALLRRHTARSGIFITAANPGSRLLSASENRGRAAELAGDIAGLDIVSLPARAVPRVSDWPF